MATTSRYATATVQAPDAAKTVASNSTQTGSGTSQSSGTSSQTQTTDQTVQNMSPQNQAMLNVLIQQLMNGGTEEQQRQIAARLTEQRKLEAQRAGYSKEAAFGDAQGIMAKTMREALDSTLPSITRAAEGAGTSQNALRALLVQDASLKAGEASAAQGLNAAVNYGNVSNGMSAIIAKLLETDSGVTSALLNALNVSKGATQTTKGTTTTEGSTTQQGSTTQTQQTGSVVDTNGGFSGTPGGNGSTAPIIYGPQQTELQAQKSQIDSTVGSTADLLKQLAGGNSWSNYAF